MAHRCIDMQLNKIDQPNQIVGTLNFQEDLENSRQEICTFDYLYPNKVEHSVGIQKVISQVKKKKKKRILWADFPLFHAWIRLELLIDFEEKYVSLVLQFGKCIPVYFEFFFLQIEIFYKSPQTEI